MLFRKTLRNWWASDKDFGIAVVDLQELLRVLGVARTVKKNWLKSAQFSHDLNCQILI